jgi:lipoprotein signal peptidase
MPERSFRWLFWILALSGLAADQASKYGVFAWLGRAKDHKYMIFGNDEPNQHRSFKLVAGFEDDECTKPHVNHGALFGFLRNYQDYANRGFAVISLLAALAIVYWSMQSATARDRWLCAALGLILAGTLGNLYDRVVFTGVRDFLHWDYGFDWPVFNIADCCLVVGAGFLLFQAFTAQPVVKPAAPAVTPRPVAETASAMQKA